MSRISVCLVLQACSGKFLVRGFNIKVPSNNLIEASSEQLCKLRHVQRCQGKYWDLNVCFKCWNATEGVLMWHFKVQTVVLFIKISLDILSVLWEAWWALAMKISAVIQSSSKHSHGSVKLPFFPCLWIHIDVIIIFVVFNWKLKSCRDSLGVGVGSWEVGNDIQPVCSSVKCFHSNSGLTSPYGEHFVTYTFVRKQTCFPPRSAFLAHLFCVCQSRVNCKEGF